jgi:hypothetical protein
MTNEDEEKKENEEEEKIRRGEKGREDREK